ncbi:MAG: acyl-CoA dehydrogenase family protein [Chloroflexi bacterium]|nr:acyl-CoA dehydrogenase family protein [Chloroflexota bacterium]
MELELKPEERLIRDTVRRFVDEELIPLEAELLRRDREGKPGLPEETLRALQEKARRMGLWGITTPQEYGGAELGLFAATLIHMELGRTVVPFVFGGEADNILFHCTEEQKQRYLLPVIRGERRCCFALTEPGAGSDARAIQMSAVKDGREWVLNGEKIFISRGLVADFAIVFAVTDPEKGGRGGVTCFIVDRDWGWRAEPIQTMDDWAVASLVFEDVRVPEENVLGEVGRGFELAMEWIVPGRIKIGAWAVGAAERLLQMALDYARQRRAFGHPIADYQAIQWMIADSAVELEAARWLVLNAAYRAEHRQDPHRHSASMAKLYASNMIQRVVDRVLQIHGGMGLTKELPIERWYRAVRKYRIFEGTDEILRRTLALNLLQERVRVGEG